MMPCSIDGLRLLLECWQEWKNAVLLTLGTGVGGEFCCYDGILSEDWQNGGHTGFDCSILVRWNWVYCGISWELELQLEIFQSTKGSQGHLFKVLYELLESYKKGNICHMDYWLDMMTNPCAIDLLLTNIFSPESSRPFGVLDSFAEHSIWTAQDLYCRMNFVLGKATKSWNQNLRIILGQ